MYTQDMENDKMNHPLEMTMKIHSEVIDWYKTADLKAQIILGILGTFIVFTTGIILTKPEDIVKTISIFDTKIWITFSLSFLCIVYGIFSAFKCVESRLNIKCLPANNKDIYADEEIYFFGYHARHDPIKLYKTLKSLDEDKKLKIYSYQIIALSKNVVRKHKYVNQGFFAISLGVFFLFLTSTLYVIKLL